MTYLGDYVYGDSIYGKFASRSTSGPTALSSGTLAVYKSSSTDQSTAGITLTASFDSVTGLNHYAVLTTADSTFYAHGSQFEVVITQGEVGGVSVAGEPVGRFTLRAQAPLYPTTTGRTLAVSTGGVADANVTQISGSTWSTTGVQFGVNAVQLGGTQQTGRDVGASVLVSSGTGAGQLSITSGVVQAQLTSTASEVLVDAVWDEVLTVATHNIANSAGRRLRTASGGQIDSGTAQAGTADSITLATSASTTEGLYVGCAIVIDSGTGAGQSRYIVGYTAGRVAYVARHWTTTPDATSTYVLFADNQVPFIHMGLAQAGGASTITLAAAASATNDIYNGQLIRVLSGTGDDQIRIITDYDGATKVATVAPAWTTQPDAASYYGTLQNGMAKVVAFEAGAIDSASIATGAVDADALAADAANEIADALLDRSGAVETGITPRLALRYAASALAGILSGAATTTVTIKAINDGATTRITATVDADGNRSAVTLS